jgi:predicted MPP superfamily phosphohydrolase
MIGGFFHSGFFGSVRAVYAALTIWFPAALLAIAAFVHVLRHPSDRHPVRPLLLVAIALILLRVYATVLEPSRLQVRQIECTSPRVSRTVRILHFSDIQVFRFGDYERRALAKMAALKPDIVLFTGDLTQPAKLEHVHGIVDDITKGLRDVNAPLGIYGVTGDTDWRLAETHVTAQQLAPLVLLNNRSTQVETKDGTVLSILGMELGVSRSPAAASQLMGRWLEKQPDGLRIVLGHNPDYVMGLNGADVDICLAGHTHGGQIRLPFIGPLLTMTHHIPREYALGHRMLGNTLVNVSAGVGSEHAGQVPPIRFLCPPDMALITVHPQQ